MLISRPAALAHRTLYTLTPACIRAYNICPSIDTAGDFGGVVGGRRKITARVYTLQTTWVPRKRRGTVVRSRQSPNSARKGGKRSERKRKEHESTNAAERERGGERERAKKKRRGVCVRRTKHALIHTYTYIYALGPAMSNKSAKPQQQQHQQIVGVPRGQLHQEQQVPPRYQPPPQPNPSAGIPKSQVQGGYGGPSAAAAAGGGGGVGGGAAAAALGHHHHHHHHQQQQQQQPVHQLQQQHLHHQQQAARLASQVKDAVQSKFAQKVDLPNVQSARSEKQLQAPGFGLHPGKSFLPPSTGPAASSLAPGAHSAKAAATTVTTQQQQQQQQQLQLQVPSSGGAANGAVGPLTTAGPNGHQVAPPRQRLSDEEYLRLGPLEMLKFVRKTESDIARLAAEQHRQIQSLVNEVRALKEANQRLSDDNQELRDLCCFLDDDRQKGRKLAREWQRFGRYTASVMRQEVSAYQNKLRQLDNKQQELIKDNLELKELCLYLDEERGGGQRDDGDGSSSSTNADETAPAPPRLPRHVSTAFNDQTMQYVRNLEQRVKQLEEDKSVLQARTQGWPAPPNEVWDSPRSPGDDFHLGGRPEAVVRALQVLEVREQLEREAGHDGEKALVREMCNVVWRKLEEGPTQNRH